MTVASELVIFAGSIRLMRRHFGFFPRLGTLLPRDGRRRRDGGGPVAAARGPRLRRRRARRRRSTPASSTPSARAAARSSWGGSGDARSPGRPHAARPARHAQLVSRRRPDVAGRPRARRLRRRAGGRPHPRRRLRAGRLQQGAGRPRLRLQGRRRRRRVRRGRARARAWTPRSTTATACPPRTTASTPSCCSRCSSTSRTPPRVLREARRVATRNVLVTTPNCTQSFGDVPVEFSHMLDTDHRQFFTVDIDARAARGRVRPRRGDAEPPARRAARRPRSCRGR